MRIKRIVRSLESWHRIVLLAVSVAAASLVGSARAQDAESSDPLLAGPKVQESADQRGEPMMGGGPGGGGPNGNRRERVQELPFQVWMSALRGVGLSPDQAESVQAIAAEFRAAQEEYQDSLTDEDRRAMRDVRRVRQANGGSPEMRERLQKLQNARPKSTPYQERIWDELTAEQQETMKAKLAELREQMAQRRAQSRERSSMDGIYDGRRRKGAAKPAEPSARDSKEAPKTAAPSQRPQRRRAAAVSEAGDGAKLDEMAKRRLEFLRSRQSPAAIQPGREPTPEQRRFKFEDDEPVDE